MPLDIEQLLLESNFRMLTPEEQSQLDSALEASPSLRREAAEIQVIKSMLRDLKAPADETFHRRLLQQLSDRKSVRTDWMAQVVRFFPRAAAAGLVVLAIAMVSIYLSEGSLDMNSLIGVDGLPPAEAEYVIDAFKL